MNTSVDQAPPETPASVKWLLIIFFGLSLFCALFDRWFVYFFQLSLTQDMLSLSWKGMQQHFFWQLLSYGFFEKAEEGIGFSFLFNLAFKCYLISIAGSSICTRYKQRFFIGFMLGATLLGACTLLPYLAIDAPTLAFSGPTAAFFALLVFWAMMHRQGSILFLFAIPLSVQWLLSMVWVATFVFCIYDSDWATFSMAFFGSLWAYLWGTTVYGLRTPYPFTWRYDDALKHLFRKKYTDRD